MLKGEDIFDPKVSADMGKRKKVYDEMFRHADELLSDGGGIIIDASFSTQSWRKQAADIAAKHARAFAIIKTTCSQSTSINRILQRTEQSYESKALTQQAYLGNKTGFERIELDGIKQIHPEY